MIFRNGVDVEYRAMGSFLAIFREEKTTLDWLIRQTVEDFAINF